MKRATDNPYGYKMNNDPYHYKSKFVIVVVAIFILLLAYGFLSGADFGGMPAAQGTDQSPQKTSDEQVQETFQRATETNDISECKSLDETRERNCKYLVLSRQAVSEDNPSLCRTVKEVEEDCISYYDTKKAIQSGDCGSAANKDQCYINLAISKSDASLCENIEDERIKNNCISVLEKR